MMDRRWVDVGRRGTSGKMQWTAEHMAPGVNDSLTEEISLLFTFRISGSRLKDALRTSETREYTHVFDRHAMMKVPRWQ